MVSPVGRRHRANWLVSCIRFSSLYHSARLICLLLLGFVAIAVHAQGSNPNIKLELVAETTDGQAIVHVRLPRGQTVEEAILLQEDFTITLAPDPTQLPVTQFIVLDASDNMVNMRSVVQANVPRLWSVGDRENSLLIYDNEVTILAPTTRTEDIDNLLSDYMINSGAPACLGEALAEIDNINRNFDRSWRILIVTVGDFSGQANCDTQELPNAPSLLDVIAITNTIDPLLQDLVDRSGGQFYTANLRLFDARINEVLSEWSQPTFALRGAIPDGWDSNALFELEIVTSADARALETLTFRDYTVPIVPTPTTGPQATDVIVTATNAATAIISNVLVPTETAANNDSTSPRDSNSIALLLIVGAVLFVIGAVVLALALSRIRRGSIDSAPQSSANYYEALHNADSENAVSATRIRERSVVSNDGTTTQIAELDETHLENIDDDLEDELLLTQVLSDERFRAMMEQSSANNETVGWMRLLTGQEKPNDFELTSNGATIGRSQECDIQITGDRAISRKHARIDVRANGQVTVSRLSAINPVMVGGIQISNRHPLAPNDVIHLSDETRLIFIANQEVEDETDITQF